MNCPYLPQAYLSFLESFRFNPKTQVFLTWDDNKQDISILMKGRWVDTILYEIPILALVSEAYFRLIDKDWDYVGQYERAFLKAERLIRGGCVFSEFGTRRRRDYRTQDLILRGLLAASKALDGPGKFGGTSNVHFAMKYDLTPIGTVAHEV
jgi:nicotinate phosphoribosyltransferase